MIFNFLIKGNLERKKDVEGYLLIFFDWCGFFYDSFMEMVVGCKIWDNV